jgi:hypothetical protein
MFYMELVQFTGFLPNCVGCLYADPWRTNRPQNWICRLSLQDFDRWDHSGNYTDRNWTVVKPAKLVSGEEAPSKSFIYVEIEELFKVDCRVYHQPRTDLPALVDASTVVAGSCLVTQVSQERCRVS